MNLQRLYCGVISSLVLMSASLLLAGCGDKTTGVNTNAHPLSTHLAATIPATPALVSTALVYPTHGGIPVMMLPTITVNASPLDMFTLFGTPPQLAFTLSDGTTGDVPLTANANTVTMDGAVPYPVALPAGDSSVTYSSGTSLDMSLVNTRDVVTPLNGVLTIKNIDVLFTVNPPDPITGVVSSTLPYNYVLNMTQLNSGQYVLNNGNNSTLVLYWDGNTSVSPVLPGQTIFGTVSLYDASGNLLVTIYQYPVVARDGKSATFYGHCKIPFSQITMTLDVRKPTLE
jgi:hypothetical protein